MESGQHIQTIASKASKKHVGKGDWPLRDI